MERMCQRSKFLSPEKDRRAWSLSGDWWWLSRPLCPPDPFFPVVFALPYAIDSAIMSNAEKKKTVNFGRPLVERTQAIFRPL
jgi:hypothetical protein